MCNDKDKRELSLEEQEAVCGGVGFVEEVTGNPYSEDTVPIVLNPKTPSNPPFGPVDSPFETGARRKRKSRPENCSDEDRASPRPSSCRALRFALLRA